MGCQIWQEIVGLVAEPLVIDELSLIRNEPVRVQARCRKPSAIRGSIEIFFNGVGKMIGFEVEGGNQGVTKGGKGILLIQIIMMTISTKEETKISKRIRTGRALRNLIGLGELTERWTLAMKSLWRKKEKMGIMETSFIVLLWLLFILQLE
jgi:hypothetical protein